MNNKKMNPSTAFQEDDYPQMQESIVGDRQFIYFEDKQAKQNLGQIPPEQINPVDQNYSITGTTERVYFQNASSVNRTQYAKDNEKYQQINAFKPSAKVQPEKTVSSQKNFSKQPKSNKLNATTGNIPDEQEDDNQFLDLNHVGKWQKTIQNKSTVQSQEMKKMNSHLEHRLTQTKWSKKKIQDPLHKTNQHGTVKSQKNPSIVASNKSNISINKSNLKQQPSTGNQDRFKKGTDKYTEGISEQEKVTSMTSWKKEEPLQQQEEEEKQSSEESPSEEESSSQQSEQEQSQESSSEEEEEQSSEQSEDEQEKSSGDEGWDQPDQPDQTESQSEKQSPFALASEVQADNVTKASKWNKSGQSKQSTSKLTDNQGSQQQRYSPEKNKKDHIEEGLDDDIEDLTEGDNEDMEIDEEWENIEKILLRIQKLVN